MVIKIFVVIGSTLIITEHIADCTGQLNSTINAQRIKIHKLEIDDTQWVRNRRLCVYVSIVRIMNEPQRDAQLTNGEANNDTGKYCYEKWRCQRAYCVRLASVAQKPRHKNKFPQNGNLYAKSAGADYILHMRMGRTRRNRYIVSTKTDEKRILNSIMDQFILLLVNDNKFYANNTQIM